MSERASSVAAMGKDTVAEGLDPPKVEDDRACRVGGRRRHPFPSRRSTALYANSGDAGGDAARGT